MTKHCCVSRACTNPDHQLQGSCTKERGISTAGSADIAVRELKAWIVLYSSSTVSADRVAHKQVFSKFAKLEDGKDVPSEADLDSLAPAQWDVAAAEPAAEAEAEGAKRRRRR